MPQIQTFNSFEGLFEGASVIRQDSFDARFLRRELEVVNPRVFKERKPKLNFLDLIEIKSDLPMWVKKSTFKSMQSRGLAKFLADAGDDFPVVTTGAEEASAPYLLAGAAVIYDQFELEAMQKMGMSLEETDILAARNAIQELANTCVWEGSKAHGIHGFLSHPDILQVEADNKIISATTGANMMIELNKLANTIPNNTEQVEAPTMAMLPPGAYQAAMQQRVTDQDSTKVLGDWIGSNGYISDVKSVRELTNAKVRGKSGKHNVALAMDPDRTVAVALYSGIKQLPIMRKGPLKYMIPFVARIGGLEVRRPKAIMRLVGV